jgi:hypothetical protein
VVIGAPKSMKYSQTKPFNMSSLRQVFFSEVGVGFFSTTFFLVIFLKSQKRGRKIPNLANYIREES